MMAAASLAALAGFGMAACSDARDPIAPVQQRQGFKPAPTSVVRASSPNIYWLSFEVHSSSLPSTLLYDIPLSNGGSDASLSMPLGKGYDVVVRAYDRYGTLTHQGEVGVDAVVLGANPLIGVGLTPVTDGVDGAKITIGVTGVSRAPNGIRVALKGPDAIHQGASAKVTATVVDSIGRTIELRPGDIQWSVSDPSGAFIQPDPAQPRMAVIAANLPRSFTVNAVYHQYTSVVSLNVPVNPVTKLAAGDNFTCALRKLGEVTCWGDDRSQALGVTTAPVTCGTSDTCATIPQQVAPGRSFVDIAAGAFHACAIESVTGDTYCWGGNPDGELGNGSTGGILGPTLVTGGHKFEHITAGLAHTCGIEAGIAYCWGDNTYGEIGNGTSGFFLGGQSVSSPTAVLTGLYGSAYTGWTQLSAGQDFTCGIIPVGTITVAKCWGYDSYVVGAGWHGNSPAESPRDVTTSYSPATPIRLGSGSVATTMCAIMQGNGAWCWGYNVGPNPIDPNSGGKTYDPIALVGGAYFTQMASGQNQSCGSDYVARVYCWGSNLHGASGQAGTSGYTVYPVLVNTGGRPMGGLASGADHVCGLSLGSVLCWGANNLGQLGNNALGNGATTTPTAVWGT